VSVLFSPPNLRRDALRLNGNAAIAACDASFIRNPSHPCVDWEVWSTTCATRALDPQEKVITAPGAVPWVKKDSSVERGNLVSKEVPPPIIRILRGPGTWGGGSSRRACARWMVQLARSGGLAAGGSSMFWRATL